MSGIGPTATMIAKSIAEFANNMKVKRSTWFKAFNTLSMACFMTTTGFSFHDKKIEKGWVFHGGTRIRVWVGQDIQNPDMTGNAPDISIFNYDGRRIGDFHGNGRRLAAGAYHDIGIENFKQFPHMEPWYMKIAAGGDDGVCISAIALEGPNGDGMMFLPELLIGCEHPIINHLPYDGNFREGYAESFTQVGSKEHSVVPKCVWFDRNKSYGLKLTELTMYLPDLRMGEKRAEEYRKNKELYCRPTPRMLPASTNDLETAIEHPIWIFNPPLKQDEKTGYDVDPSRVLNWEPHRNQIGDWAYWGNQWHIDMLYEIDKMMRKLSILHRKADVKPLKSTINIRDSKTDVLSYANATTNGNATFHDNNLDTNSTLFANTTLHSNTSEVYVITGKEDLSPHNDARYLVILNTTSTDADNVDARCVHDNEDHVQLAKHDPRDNPDLFAPREGVYCDMVLRAKYPVCTFNLMHLCFDPHIKMLRRFSSNPIVDWLDHDNEVVEGHKKNTLREKRAVDMATAVEADNRAAVANGIPIKYRVGDAKPYWNRPYHPSRITEMD